MTTILGNNIKKRRKELHLTQLELARAIGNDDRTSIAKIENGRRISYKLLVKIANALQTDPFRLMGMEDYSQLEQYEMAEDFYNAAMSDYNNALRDSISHIDSTLMNQAENMKLYILSNHFTLDEYEDLFAYAESIIERRG